MTKEYNFRIRATVDMRGNNVFHLEVRAERWVWLGDFKTQDIACFYAKEWADGKRAEEEHLSMPDYTFTA